MAEKSEQFATKGLDDSVLSGENVLSNPAFNGATLLFQQAPGLFIPYEYAGVAYEIGGYPESAWIGTTLMQSPIYDVYGPDACKFLNSVSVNDFTKLKYKGIRHMLILNDKGQILSDGVVMRIAEDRYRTYWLNPPIQYLVETSDMDVHGEDMTGKEYFIQIDGVKSLEILEDALQQDLHDIAFAHRRTVEVDGHEVLVLRLGMSGDLAYEIHGPIDEYAYMYERVWASGKKFGARPCGNHAYAEFNHTEGGFPNILQHYPMPLFESDPGLTEYLRKNPGMGGTNLNRKLIGSSTDLEERFVTPYDVGWDFLIRYDHEFTGKAALEAIKDNPPRTLVTLEWNPEDIGAVMAAMNTPGGEPVDDISQQCDMPLVSNSFFGQVGYRADDVLTSDGVKVGITAGRIHSYNYNATISLAFVSPKVSAEGTELVVLWGTPGTKQMKIRAKVAHTPYNDGPMRNSTFDVEKIPHRFA
jgi:vanillate/3-O-methylgallate O-demethylase